jgi:hypothetical protein
MSDLFKKVQETIDAIAAANPADAAQLEEFRIQYLGAKGVVKAFMEENEIKTIEWPAVSPIENVWNVLKIKAMNPRPRTHKDMRDAILEIWLNLEDRIRVGLIDTFRGRLRKCVAAKGDIIKFK